MKAGDIVYISGRYINEERAKSTAGTHPIDYHCGEQIVLKVIGNQVEVKNRHRTGGMMVVPESALWEKPTVFQVAFTGEQEDAKLQ